MSLVYHVPTLVIVASLVSDLHYYMMRYIYFFLMATFM